MSAAHRLHDPALARRALLARPVPAVALRRRLPRRRVLGRSGEGRLVPAGRASTRTRIRAAAPSSSPTGSRARRRAASCSIPSRSQYKEAFLVVNALLDGEEVTTCPFIWVDRDFALTRGWLQGFPKKLGSIWITRTFGLDSPADPGVKAGRDVRRHLRRLRAPRRGGDGDARADLRDRPDAQRPADRQRAPLRPARGRPPRRPGRARARALAQPRPGGLAGLGGKRDARALRRRRTRSTTCSRPCGSARASASRSGTPSTTRRSSRTCGDEPGGARHRRRNGHRRGGRPAARGATATRSR